MKDETCESFTQYQNHDCDESEFLPGIAIQPLEISLIHGQIDCDGLMIDCYTLMGIVCRRSMFDSEGNHIGDSEVIFIPYANIRFISQEIDNSQ